LYLLKNVGCIDVTSPKIAKQLLGLHLCEYETSNTIERKVSPAERLVNAEELGVSQKTLPQAVESERAEIRRLLGSRTTTHPVIASSGPWVLSLLLNQLRVQVSFRSG
jgi:HAMP domain-containing protein